MSSSIWKGVVKAADRLSGKIPESGPELVSYMTRKDLETKADGRKTWKSWNNYTLTQLARELAKESRYSKYQKKECYEMLIHRLLDFRFFAHMLKAIMVVEEELLLDFREAAYVLQLFKDCEIPPHIIEKEVQHPKFKERLQKKDKITLKDLIAHLQNVNYKIWVDDHQEDWGHAIRKRARRIYKYLDDPEELAIARAKAQGKPIPKRSKPAPAKQQSQSKVSSKASSHQSSSKKKSSNKAKAQPKAPTQKAPTKSAAAAAASKSSGQKSSGNSNNKNNNSNNNNSQNGQSGQGDDFDFFGDAFGNNGGNNNNNNNNNNGNNGGNEVHANEDPSLNWLAGLNTSNLQNMSGFDVETGAQDSGVTFGFGDFDDEKGSDSNDEDMDADDDDMENMFDKLAKHTNVNLLEATAKKPQNLKNAKGKTMSQMASQTKHSGDLNQAMAPSSSFTDIKDPFSNYNVSSDPFADMNKQMVAQKQQQQAQVNQAFSEFGNFGGNNNGYGMNMNNVNNMNNMSNMNNMGMGMNNNNNNNNNAAASLNSPTDLFSMNASQGQNPSSIFGKPDDPFANLSSQYGAKPVVNTSMNYGNRNKPKDAFSDLGVLK